MSYNEDSLVKLKHLKGLAEKLNSEIDTVNTRIDDIITVGGEPNVITAIKVNNISQTITDKTVDISVPTNVSELTNDSDYQTKDDVDNAINAKIGSVYQAGGSVYPDNLPDLIEDNIGLVVNVTDPFITDEDFVEGPNNQYPTGTNILIVKSGSEIKYDVLSGVFDTSNFVEKESGKGLSTNDFTNEDKAKLDILEQYTLPTASDTTLGGIKISQILDPVAGDLGSNVRGNLYRYENSDTVLVSIPFATNTTPGASYPGDGLSIESTGKLSVNIASDTEVTEMLAEIFG